MLRLRETVSRICVSARVRVTLPSLATPADDITRLCADMLVWDSEVLGASALTDGKNRSETQIHH